MRSSGSSGSGRRPSEAVVRPGARSRPSSPGSGWTVAALTLVAFVAGYRFGLRRARRRRVRRRRARSWSPRSPRSADRAVDPDARSRTHRVAVGDDGRGEVMAENPHAAPSVPTSPSRSRSARVWSTSPSRRIGPRRHASSGRSRCRRLRRGVLDVGPVTGGPRRPRRTRPPRARVDRRASRSSCTPAPSRSRRRARASSATSRGRRPRDLAPQRHLLPRHPRVHAGRRTPRTIHWKSTAKTGALMVRQFEDTRRSAPRRRARHRRAPSSPTTTSSSSRSSAAGVPRHPGHPRRPRGLGRRRPQRTPEFAKREVLRRPDASAPSPRPASSTTSRSVGLADACLPHHRGLARIVGERRRRHLRRLPRRRARPSTLPALRLAATRLPRRGRGRRGRLRPRGQSAVPARRRPDGDDDRLPRRPAARPAPIGRGA